MQTNVPMKSPTKRIKTHGRPHVPWQLAQSAWADINDVCALMRVAPDWVHLRRREGSFPSPVTSDHRFLRWKLADILAYMNSIEECAPEVDPISRVDAKRVDARHTEGGL